jgi:hypothetical protein
MITRFGRCFSRFQGHSQSPRHRVRKPSCRVVLQAEALEDRMLPSLTPTLLLDVNPGSASSYPSSFTQVNGLVL